MPRVICHSSVTFALIVAVLASDRIDRVDGRHNPELSSPRSTSFPQCLPLYQYGFDATRRRRLLELLCLARSPLAEGENPMSGTPVIHVVDDDPSFRTAISRLLKVSGYEVADYESAACFLRAMENARPGCIVLDVKMPTLGGLQLQEQLAKLSHTWPIIFITGQGDIPTTVRAIKGGAEDFLSKPVPRQTLLEAIERALVRHAATKQKQDRLDSLRSLVSTLTPREANVFALMVRGKPNKQIAHLLGTSERTVKAHRHMVMSKLQVQSFAEAVSIAERAGLLTQSPPELRAGS
jgi:FixJ family two-component response regulator